jgi:hypothetical protein
LFKLSPANPQEIAPAIAPILVQGEEIVSAYKGMRDFVVFTSKRPIAVNVQGMTGKKRDFTSLPYSKVQAYSIETAGTFDLNWSWISGSAVWGRFGWSAKARLTFASSGR